MGALMIEEAAVAVSADLGQFLDREWDDTSLSDSLNAPVRVLGRVSGGDTRSPTRCVHVKTVGDLGKDKFFRAAQALTLLGEAGVKVPGRRSACTEVAERELELAAGESVPALGQVHRWSSTQPLDFG